MMGESIAVKGGQVAYLVPAECIGTVKGESVIGQNPINAEKENDIIDFRNEYGDEFKEVDFDRKVYRLGGKSLSEFGVADMNHIRKVYAPYRGDYAALLLSGYRRRATLSVILSSIIDSCNRRR